MSEVLKNIELIENYFERNLSDSEMKDFETRLLIDIEFKEEFELYKNVVAGIKESGEANLKAKLKEADSEIDKGAKELSIKKSNKKRIYILSIAASFLLIVVAGFLWKMNQNPNLSTIASKYYEKDKGLPVTMSVSENNFNTLMNKYKTADYSRAKLDLDLLLKNNSNNDTVIYYLGVVEYELTNYTQAELQFKSIKSESSFYQKAEYRLLLAYLQKNKIVDAKSIASKIALNPNHLYFEKGNDILKELSFD